MMAHGDLTDEQWQRLEPLLPPKRSGKKGHPYRAHRPVLNGILWIQRTGAPWQDLPAHYPPRSTCHDRLMRWQRDGVWEQILQGPDGRPPKCGGAEKGGAEPVASEALGRSRGGLTTKVHLASEGKGRPLCALLSEGQRHDSTQLERVLDGIRVPRQTKEGAPKRGRPRKRPQRLLLDKGYAYPKCRKALRRRGIASMIPERKDQREQRQI